MTKSFKLCIIGNRGTGKTTWIDRLLGFTTPASPTHGALVRQIAVPIKDEMVRFTVWECPVSEYADIYYTDADCAIYLTFNGEFNSDIVDDFRRVCPGRPIMVVNNSFENYGVSINALTGYNITTPLVQIYDMIRA